MWLGVVAALPLLLQFVGVPYRDYLKDVVPAPFLVDGFNTAYPFFYDSPLTKSNGWLALEPSFMSFTLGLCIMAGLLSRARTWKVAVATIGMLCTVAGSGFAIVLVGLLVMVLTGQGYLLKKYLIPGAVLAAIAIPNFVKARQEAQAKACINNLKQLDAAANQFALERGRKTGDAVSYPDDLTPYVKLNSAGSLPPCPAGGSYSVTTVGTNPVCSLGSTVNPPHILP